MMDTPSDFARVQSSATSALVSTTRAASQLAAEDLPFHRSLDPAIDGALNRQNARLLSLAERLLGTATANAETVRPAPRLSDIEAVEGNWRAVVDVVDSLLERADTALDEFTGAVRRLSPRASETPEREPTGWRQKPGRLAAAWRNREIGKPQLLFEHVPTNQESGPFKPLLQNKPHALGPLEKEPVASKESGNELQYPHPYQREIEQYEYPSSLYTHSEPIMYHPFESTTATLVDTEDGMYEMLAELKRAKEIAIDLEHHDQRSYVGIVSLMQISTRDKDWIVDTLKPWRRKLECLNEVFADPSILKVLHGAHMDVMWLQRDLGLYLVGLFDTHHAARVLGYSGGSYAYLLKRFTGVDAQKQYQMADWRVRPLPKELLDYARSDTHYLLYIYDHMRNELIAKSDLSKPDHEGDKLHDVLVRSSEVALQRYEHPMYDYELGQGPVGWYKLLAKTPALLTKEQFSVFRAVHKWRDNVAREQDDSVHYVMPNHQIFSIAKAMPTTRADLLGIAQPTSQTLRLRADELVSVIIKAKEDGKQGPEMMDVMNQIEPQFPRRHTQSGQAAHSVAAFVPRTGVPPLPAIDSTPPALPLRSATSTFWGAAFHSSAHQQRLPASTVASVDLGVPLPPLNAELFADAAEGAPSTPVMQSEQSSSMPTPATEEPQQAEDDVFVLKEFRKKRRRPISPAPIDGMAAQSDEVAIPDDETERLSEKAERRKAKKAAKRAKKAAEAAATTNGISAENGGSEEVPFDYSSAPSILNPPRESREDMRARKKKEVNPYAKSLDTAKGLPRAQREKAGRTMTYKSS